VAREFPGPLSLSMRPLIAACLLPLSALPQMALAQTATVIESTTSKQAYTFANASGFSITNNGTMVYDGPLNQLTGSPCCISANLTVNREAIKVNTNDFERDTGMKASRGGGNTLSAERSEAVIPATGSVMQIGLQYSVTVGGVTKVGTSDSNSLQEKVDAQSLSIFPQFNPSVFP
jgi:hypothetical protein